MENGTEIFSTVNVEDYEDYDVSTTTVLINIAEDDFNWGVQTWIGLSTLFVVVPICGMWVMCPIYLKHCFGAISKPIVTWSSWLTLFWYLRINYVLEKRRQTHMTVGARINQDRAVTYYITESSNQKLPFNLTNGTNHNSFHGMQTDSQLTSVWTVASENTDLKSPYQNINGIVENFQPYRTEQVNSLDGEMQITLV